MDHLATVLTDVQSSGGELRLALPRPYHLFFGDVKTSILSECAGLTLCAHETKKLELPVADPMRCGPAFEALVDSCLA